jgi:hypothetical protein
MRYIVVHVWKQVLAKYSKIYVKFWTKKRKNFVEIDVTLDITHKIYFLW